MRQAQAPRFDLAGTLLEGMPRQQDACFDWHAGRAATLTTPLPAGALAPRASVVAVRADVTRLEPMRASALSAPKKEEHHA